jgi:predicted small lipoprotein YifL
MNTARLWILAILAASVLGCGQKGPLVLPDAQHTHKKVKFPSPKTPSAAPAAPATAPGAAAPSAPGGPAPDAAPPQAAPGAAAPDSNSTPNPAPQS